MIVVCETLMQVSALKSDSGTQANISGTRIQLLTSVHLNPVDISIGCVAQCKSLYSPLGWLIFHALIETKSTFVRNHDFINGDILCWSAIVKEISP